MGPVRHVINFCMGCFRPYVADQYPTTKGPQWTPTLQLFSTQKQSLVASKCVPYVKTNVLHIVVYHWRICSKSSYCSIAQKISWLPHVWLIVCIEVGGPWFHKHRFVSERQTDSENAFKLIAKGEMKECSWASHLLKLPRHVVHNTL